MTQKELSEKSGVSYGSLRRFEESGNISFLSLTKLARELGCLSDIKQLFTKVPYQSIEEVLRENR